MNSMKITENENEVLGIFKNINPSILFKPGKKVSTISNNKNIMGVVEFAEFDVPTTAPIYDLNVFMSTMRIVSDGNFTDAEIDFEDNLVNISHGRSKMKYYYADERMITAPPENIADLGTPVQTVTIGYADFLKMFNAAQSFGLPDICFTAHNGKLDVVVTDKRNTASNVFTVHLGESDQEFCFCVKTENLSVVKWGGLQSNVVTSYNVSLYSQKVAKLSANIKKSAEDYVRSLDLFIALEPDSEY